LNIRSLIAYLLLVVFLIFNSCGKGSHEDIFLAEQISEILMNKELAETNPFRLSVFERNNMTPKPSKINPYWWSFEEQTRNYRLIVKFQKDDDGNWDHLKTKFLITTRGKPFFEILLEHIRKGSRERGFENHWGTTRNYTWKVTP